MCFFLGFMWIFPSVIFPQRPIARAKRRASHSFSRNNRHAPDLPLPIFRLQMKHPRPGAAFGAA